jgi:hypothetical protein
LRLERSEHYPSLRRTLIIITPTHHDTVTSTVAMSAQGGTVSLMMSSDIGIWTQGLLTGDGLRLHLVNDDIWLVV